MFSGSFGGEYRTKPVQSLGGAKKESREEFLARAQQERERREQKRLEQHSSTIISSAFRSYRVRRDVHNRWREDFDELRKHGKAADLTGLAPSCKLLISFYTSKKDADRLIWLCQCLLKVNSMVIQTSITDKVWYHRLKKLLEICCSQLLSAMAATGPSSSVTVPLRMIEVFTDPSYFTDYHYLLDILLHLIHRGYYSCLHHLLLHRVPPGVSRHSKPPALAETLMELIFRPLRLLPVASDNRQRCVVVRELSVNLLVQPLPGQVSELVLPYLSQQKLLPLPHMVTSWYELVVRADDGLALSPWLLYSILTLADTHYASLSLYELITYIQLVEVLSVTLFPHRQDQDDDEDEEEEDVDDTRIMDVSEPEGVSDLPSCTLHTLRLLNSPNFLHCTLGLLDLQHPQANNTNILHSVATIAYHIITHAKATAVYTHKLLYTLTFRPTFLAKLWYAVVSCNTMSFIGSEMPLIQQLSQGISPHPKEVHKILPLLSLFATMFSHTLKISSDDDEFQVNKPRPHSLITFSLSELVHISSLLRDVCLGLIELAYPETRNPTTYTNHVLPAHLDTSHHPTHTSHHPPPIATHQWSHLFRALCQVLKQLYSRDIRLGFCPAGHWLSSRANVEIKRYTQSYRKQRERQITTFPHPRHMASSSSAGDKDDDASDAPPLSTKEFRQLTILKEIPFVVAFEERVKILQTLITTDRLEYQDEQFQFERGNYIEVRVRRDYLYEDAYDRLTPENEGNMKKRMQVHMINMQGLAEAGIDGGGIFREFLTQLLRTGFDPNRGFFRQTQDHQLLYPNPEAPLIHPGNFREHYYFLGRMLGKALYERLLVELPFADFFLSKLLERGASDVDIHHLASLDPLFYKNLLSVKHYEGDVRELHLDFSVLVEQLGSIKKVQLKPNGSDILVTNSNKIEFVYHMAHYKLNVEIREQCQSFKAGLFSVVDGDWLQMFDYKELQTLISGSLVPIDFLDMKHHTTYTGGYSLGDDTIQYFWSVVEEMDDDHKRRLLKFITSCSRPPLFGFKELYPPLSIQNVGNVDRLPTASTCMNLLKLPKYPSREVLREKLLYAVTSEAGFELS